MKRKPTPAYFAATAIIWGTCYEIAASRWLALHWLYKHYEGGR